MSDKLMKYLLITFCVIAIIFALVKVAFHLAIWLIPKLILIGLCYWLVKFTYKKFKK